jgi:hypothetical protein
MFRGFRKKTVKEPVDIPTRRTSLPDVTSQDVQWPEDLVDITAIRLTPPPEPQPQGAAPVPISFQTDERGNTPFHKPFRQFIGRSHDGGDRSISSIYMSQPPPSAFLVSSGATARVGQRRTRVPPKFNLMVSREARFVRQEVCLTVCTRLPVRKVLAKLLSCVSCLTPRTSLPLPLLNNARPLTVSCAVASRQPLAFTPPR